VQAFFDGTPAYGFASSLYAIRENPLLNAAKVMSSSQVELPNAAEAELRGK
jgi:hypothetical protein